MKPEPRRRRSLGAALATLAVSAVVVGGAYALPPANLHCSFNAAFRATVNGSAGTMYQYNCTGGKYFEFVSDSAPIVHRLSVSSATGAAHLTASLHRTTQFRLLVERVVGLRHVPRNQLPPSERRQLPAAQSALVPALARVGTIALGEQHKGLASIAFTLAPNGSKLRRGDYELSLQALAPNGAVKSSSRTVSLAVKANGDVLVSIGPS